MQEQTMIPNNVKLFKKACITVLIVFVMFSKVRADFTGYEKIISPELFEQAGSSEDSHAIVVVTLKVASSSGTDNEATQQMILSSIKLQQKVIARLSSRNGKVESQLKNTPIFSAKVSKAGLMELSAMDEVLSIEKNWPMQLHTAQGIPLMKPGAYRNVSGGKGVAIAIVDTGFNYNHPALGMAGYPNDKIIGGYDFGEDDNDPMEGISRDHKGNMNPSYHGTASAGITAGNNSTEDSYIGGVATESKIYALKIADSNGHLSLMSMLKAWDWCITHQYDDPENPIMIISNSIGIPRFQASSYCDKRMPALSQTASKVVSKGIAVFVSSGNEYQTNSIACPSCLKDTISVGAVFDDNLSREESRWGKTAEDMVTPYSNSSEILDLLAPSNDAVTPGFPGNTYLTNFGGTSAACPYAAGAAAIIQSYHKNKFNRFLTVVQLKKIMVENGDLIRDKKSGITKPRINISKSVKGYDNLQTLSSPDVPQQKTNVQNFILDDLDISAQGEGNDNDKKGKTKTVVDY